MKSFPIPLSTKEEQLYIRLCKDGDREAREILIERNLRLVAHIVKKYNTNEREIDDLISIGTIGLIKAIDTFDAEKGIRLATYASRCIENELLMMLRNGKKQSKDVYLYEPIGADKEGNEINLLDIIESVDEDVVEDNIFSNGSNHAEEEDASESNRSLPFLPVTIEVTLTGVVVESCC